MPPRYLVAVCLGSRSQVDRSKLVLLFAKLLPLDQLEFIEQKDSDAHSSELAVYVAQKAPDADLCIASQRLDVGSVIHEEIYVFYGDKTEGQYIDLLIEKNQTLEEQLVSHMVMCLERPSLQQ